MKQTLQAIAAALVAVVLLSGCGPKEVFDPAECWIAGTPAAQRCTYPAPQSFFQCEDTWRCVFKQQQEFLAEIQQDIRDQRAKTQAIKDSSAKYEAEVKAVNGMFCDLLADIKDALEEDSDNRDLTDAMEGFNRACDKLLADEPSEETPRLGDLPVKKPCTTDTDCLALPNGAKMRCFTEPGPGFEYCIFKEGEVSD